ncbi:hypothetical protein AVEN_154147-1, partial [Araneus ventricosus]
MIVLSQGPGVGSAGLGLSVGQREVPGRHVQGTAAVDAGAE